MATANTMAPPPSSTSPTSSALTSQTHRRIDLQSPLDLSYLLNNARASARAKIDLHLPLQSLHSGPGATDGAADAPGSGANAGSGGAGAELGALGAGDEMRRSVERSVDKYLEDTFEMVKQSVIVNGIEGEKVDWGDAGGPEEFEIYDANLASRITAMYSTIESLNLQLSNTRREACAAAARSFQDSFVQQSEELESAMGKQEEVARKAGEVHAEETGDLTQSLGLQGGFGDRQEDVSREWEEALEKLVSLQRSLGESREQAEGASKVVDYMEGQ